MARELATWGEMESAAADLARLGRARLDAVGVAFLGTLRKSGAPRISPVEPHVVRGQLLIGGMSWSRKVADLRRDPRCVLHTVVTGPDTGEGELKVSAEAVEADGDLRGAAPDAWWAGWPADRTVVFCLLIDEAVYVEWEVEAGLMVTHRWSPGSGETRDSRPYP